MKIKSNKHESSITHALQCSESAITNVNAILLSLEPDTKNARLILQDAELSLRTICLSLQTNKPEITTIRRILLTAESAFTTAILSLQGDDLKTASQNLGLAAEILTDDRLIFKKRKRLPYVVLGGLGGMLSGTAPAIAIDNEISIRILMIVVTTSAGAVGGLITWKNI